MDFRVGYATGPQHVIERDQAAGTQKRQARFVIGVVVGLVGVDECEIERSGATFSNQRSQRLGCRRELELDAISHTGLLPVSASDVRPLFADVATDELAAGGQRRRNGQRAVSGESADLD